jgi:peptidoglycan/xylan/chitin deacetylase (PgdA/CDA1 family)
MGSEFRVALTFDDGPHPKNTELLVKILSERVIPATFFVLGENVDRWPNVLRFIHECGHEIGNHAWSHQSFGTLSDESILRELTQTNVAIRKITSQDCSIYRPPYGVITNRQRQVIERELHYKLILWNVDSLDWQSSTVDALIHRTINFTTKRAVLLFHDFADRTCEALPRILDSLVARDCVFCIASLL